jgi:hypothetical protein
MRPTFSVRTLLKKNIVCFPKNVKLNRNPLEIT